MRNLWGHAAARGLLVAGLLSVAFSAQADVITDWNPRAGDFVSAYNPGPPGNATLVLVQTAVFDAVNAITQQYPLATGVTLKPAAGASVDAAVAVVNRVLLLKFAPSQQTGIESAYPAAMAGIPEGKSKADGLAIGEQAVAELLARRTVKAANTIYYRPVTRPGMYVPTVVPVGGDTPPVTLHHDRTQLQRPRGPLKSVTRTQ